MHTLSCNCKFWISVLLFFFVIGPSQICLAQSPDQRAISELKEKYTFGSIYLTNTLLNNYQQHLNDPSKIKPLESTSIGKEVLALFRGFLDGVAIERADLTRSTAFLQLDVNLGVAGFKRSSDRNGVITKLPWTERQVHMIARLSDLLSNGQLTIEAKLGAFNNGSQGLAEGWATIKQFREDPYIQTKSLSQYLLAFDDVASKKSNDLAILKATQTSTFKEIEEFRNSLAKTRPQIAISANVPTNLLSENAKTWGKSQLLVEKAVIDGLWKATNSPSSTKPVLNINDESVRFRVIEATNLNNLRDIQLTK